MPKKIMQIHFLDTALTVELFLIRESVSRMSFIGKKVMNNHFFFCGKILGNMIVVYFFLFKKKVDYDGKI